MASKFKTVGIFGRVRNAGVTASLHALIAHMQTLNQDIVLDSETAAALDETNVRSVPPEELSKNCDILIVVGGDGSLLRAAHTVIHDETPVLGINRGRLGFLTDIHPSELEKIEAILAGDYIMEKRFMLEATVELHGEIVGKRVALNEAALMPDRVPHMSEFEIYIDDKFVCSQDSDGIIIATPTGSTAYALSGGGPILHPELDVMVMVPMYPHTLSMRPLVIDGNRKVTIVITPNNTVTPQVACDGQPVIDAVSGSRIHISKRKERLHLIHPTDYDYYETLRSKLHWGHKLQYME